MLKEEIETVERLNKIDGLDDINRGLSEEDNLKIKSELQKTDINRECIMEGRIPLCKEGEIGKKSSNVNSFKAKLKISFYIVIFLIILFLIKYL